MSMQDYERENCYECESYCPKCDSGDIEWSAKDIQDNIVYQNAICQGCGCKFTEIWKYSYTEIDEPIENEVK